MIIFITVICIILATAIIALVLLQQGKGSDLGSAFGGGSSNSMFGALGPSGFLGKLTYILVAIWLILSMALAYLVKFDDNKNLFEDTEIAKEEKEDTTGDFPSQ
ncbi:MAG: preprotein translocase subunit SecG [Gammaproteobacteria bacterium]